MSNNVVVGTWQLVSWEAKPADGDIYYPFGEDPKGYITYTEQGYMSVAIMKSHRQNLEIPTQELMEARRIFLKPWKLITAWKYIKAIFNYFQAAANYVSYSGQYEIQGNTIIHHVEVSLIPDWRGTKLERHFQLSDNRLVLTTPPMSGSPQYLTWERV